MLCILYTFSPLSIAYSNYLAKYENTNVKLGIADESTEKWLRQKVINMNHATENLLKIAVYCEEVRQATEESLADNAEINSKP